MIYTSDGAALGDATLADVTPGRGPRGWPAPDPAQSGPAAPARIPQGDVAVLPLYVRLLRLRHLRPGAFACFLLFEGVTAVAVLLGLAELSTWWGVLVLPVAVAFMVKLNDLAVGSHLDGAARSTSGPGHPGRTPPGSPEPAGPVDPLGAVEPVTPVVDDAAPVPDGGPDPGQGRPDLIAADPDRGRPDRRSPDLIDADPAGPDPADGGPAVQALIDRVAADCGLDDQDPVDHDLVGSGRSSAARESYNQPRNVRGASRGTIYRSVAAAGDADDVTRFPVRVSQTPR